MIQNDYVYDSRVLAITDGDTAKFGVRLRPSRMKEIDLGFGVKAYSGSLWIQQTIRMLGYNADESGTESGETATSWLAKRMPLGSMVVIKTVAVRGRDKQEKYGRFLASVFVAGSDTSLNEQIVAAGFGKPWDGQGDRPTLEELT